MYESQERIKTLKRALQDPKDSFGQRYNLVEVFFFYFVSFCIEVTNFKPWMRERVISGLTKESNWPQEMGVFVKDSSDSIYLILDSYESANHNC